MTALVIGVGNPFRRDDGIGPAVAAEVARRSLAGVRVLLCSDDPVEMLAAWTDTELAVVVDAAVGEDSVPGRIRRWTPDVRPPCAAVSSHGLDVPSTYALGRSLGRIPRRLLVLAVDAADVRPGLGLSPAVAAVVPDVVGVVVSEITG